VVSFQNTGREMPETLDFVREIGERFGVNIVWLEYRSSDPRFVIVDHGSASRDGEPFEQLIRKRKFLPNQAARFCTAELKVRAAKRYLMSIGWTRWTVATGIRADEPRRLGGKKIKDRWVNWSPMAAAGIGKADVAEFWRRQAFDLRLPNQNGKTPLGNCDGCFLKAEAIQAHLAVNYPERHAWWERMEALASELTSGTGAAFSSRFAKRDIREFMERQGDWLSVEGALCQVDDGECFA
jgi:3'-phosphoadenosine 5'-phosphosulfate sulfotransferase (PAPS reductase)/FAD synthetase